MIDQNIFHLFAVLLIFSWALFSSGNFKHDISLDLKSGMRKGYLHYKTTLYQGANLLTYTYSCYNGDKSGDKPHQKASRADRNVFVKYLIISTIH